MGSLGAPELLIILAIVLLLFGSTRLPKMARSLGQASKEFKKGIDHGAEEGDDAATKDDKADKAAAAEEAVVAEKAVKAEVKAEKTDVADDAEVVKASAADEVAAKATAEKASGETS